MATSPASNGFTQIWNALIVDHRLGATAYRIASYLGSKTSDWTIREKHITETLGIGHAAYLTAMRELNAAGYITRGKTTRDKLGHIRSDPSTLNRGLIVADPQKPSSDRSRVTERPVDRPPVSHTSEDRSSYPTLETQQEERLGKRAQGESREDQMASEGAPAPERTCPHCDEFKFGDLRRHIFDWHNEHYHKYLMHLRSQGLA